MERQITADPSDLQTFAIREAQKVESAMRQDLTEALTDNDPLLSEVLDYALFSGGKRIRPLLVILASQCCGTSGDSLYKLAAAFEYLHVATLIHDDVIDHAEERRGRKSLITVYGLAAAILSGDWLHARSMNLIGRLTGAAGLELFSMATTAMVNGEFLQLRFAADSTVREDQYFSVIHQKTAGLIGIACEIGALFAQADKIQRAALKNYGYHIGNSFQVIDDLLDYQGDQKITGKKIGNDFAEGKLTLPLIRTLETCTTEDRMILVDLLAGNRTNPDHFRIVRELIAKNNGFESAFATAEELAHKAIDALDIFSAENAQKSRSVLRSLALYILSRNK